MSEGTERKTTSSNENLPKRKDTIKADDQKVTNQKEVKKPSMPTYGKYNILKILKENHCLMADEQQLCSAFPRNERYNLDDIKNFVNKAAQKSQSIIDKHHKSTEFKRATELIKSIEDRSRFTDQTLDIPLSLKTITDVFHHNEEEVDVRMLYQTLTNMSLGFPITGMDDLTTDFLYGVHKEFMELVDTPQFQQDIRQYQNYFNKATDDLTDVKHTTPSDMQVEIKSALNCPTLNPLNVPYSLLHKPRDSL